MLDLAGMKLYDVQDLAELLSLHEKTVRSLLRNGTLTGKKLAKKWYVTEDSLKVYFSDEPVKAEPEATEQDGKRSVYDALTSS